MQITPKHQNVDVNFDRDFSNTKRENPMHVLNYRLHAYCLSMLEAFDPKEILGPANPFYYALVATSATNLLHNIHVKCVPGYKQRGIL